MMETKTMEIKTMETKNTTSFLEDIDKPESFKEEVFIKQKKNLIPTFILSSLILIISIVFFILLTKGTYVPDMAGWRETDAYSWAKKNNVTILRKDEFSLTYDTGLLIMQGLDSGTKIKRNGTINITFSKGADPNQLIDFADLKEMDVASITQWIQENKLTGISIIKENSTVFEVNKVINFEIIDGNATSFMRKNRVKVYVSLGSKELQDTVVVPDFAGKTKADVLKWSDKNKLLVNIMEEFNEYIPYGQISTQSIASDTKMKRDDSLEVIVSLGNEILVPSFVGITRAEASELATFKNMQVYYTLEVSRADSGTIIAQDIAPSTSIHQKQLVTLTVATASDSIIVPNFIGLSSSEASSLASLYSLKTFFMTTKSTEKVGVIIDQSKAEGESILNNNIVTLYVSSGDVVLPDFIGLSKEKASLLAEQKGLKIIFNELKTTLYPNNEIIGQNLEAAISVEATRTVTLDIAINSGVMIPDFSTMNKIDAQKWASNHGVTLSIQEVYSDVKSIGKLFEQNYLDELLPINGTVNIKVSLGKVAVTNFVGQTKLDVLQWQSDVNQKGASIKINFIPVMDSLKSLGTVIDQSIKSDVVSLSQSLDIWISGANNHLDIPNFNAVDRVTFENWCSQNKVTYTIKDLYSESYNEGVLFNQNYVNTSVPEGEMLVIYHSIGKLYIGDYIGKTKAEIEGFINAANVKGANITITYGYKTSFSIEKEHVLEQSTKSNELKLGTTLSIILSGGKELPMPSLAGLSITNAIDILESKDLEYTITYEKSVLLDGKPLYGSNVVMTQSVSAGTYVSQTRLIGLVVAIE